jgi:hypothetical protein
MRVRALRRWFILEMTSCINELRSSKPSALRGKMVRFSAVPAEEYWVGGLHSADSRYERKLQKRHERAGFLLVFGGIDISLMVS